MRRNRQGRVTTTPDFSDMSIALVCMVALQHRRRGWCAGSDFWRLDDLGIVDCGIWRCGESGDDGDEEELVD